MKLPVLALLAVSAQPPAITPPLPSNRPTPPPVAANADGTLSAAVKAVRERRVREAPRPKAGKNTFRFTSPDDAPGLELTLAVTLPKGATIIEVQQPTALEAKDSVGTDLAAIDKGFGGEREYLKLPMSFGDDPPNELTLRLAAPARKAESFTVKGKAGVIVSTGAAPVNLAPTKDWTALKHESIGDREVEYRTKSKGGQTTLELRPASLKHLVEAFEVVSGGNATEHTMTMTTGSVASFHADTDLPDDGVIRVRLRTGVQALTLPLEWTNEPLP